MQKGEAAPKIAPTTARQANATDAIALLAHFALNASTTSWYFTPKQISPIRMRTAVKANTKKVFPVRFSIGFTTIIITTIMRIAPIMRKASYTFHMSGLFPEESSDSYNAIAMMLATITNAAKIV